jgi:hypothetical protein
MRLVYAFCEVARKHENFLEGHKNSKAQGITAKRLTSQKHYLNEVKAPIARQLKHEQVPQSDTRTPRSKHSQQ